MAECEDEADFKIDLVHNDGMADIQRLVVRHKKITLPNAILLNEALIDQLRTLLVRLEESLAKCQAKYEDNERLLGEMDEAQPKIRRHLFFYDRVVQNNQYCGWPYFKAISGNGPEPNPEAAYRSNLKTLYPHDLNRQMRVQWTLSDKSLLIACIKTQMIDYCRKNKLLTESEARATTLLPLIEKISGHPFQFDWQRVSDQIFGRHTPFECQAMWRLVQHPHLDRTAWTEEEDDMLLETAQINDFQNWGRIAEMLSTPRSMFQCFIRYQTTFNDARKNTGTKFTPQEDQQLVALVQKHKVGAHIPWGTIARSMPNRSKQTLYYRYIFSLRPNISRERFSAEEDCIFLAAIQDYGLDFRKIAQEFPNRTVVQLRSHYNIVLKRNAVCVPWTLKTDEQLMELHAKGHSWADIADVIKDHNRVQCRARYVTITNFLKKNPKKTVKDVARRNRPSTNGVTTANWNNKLNEICNKLSSDAKPPDNDVVKIGSFAKILDISVEEELIDEFRSEFSVSEMTMLRKVLGVDKGLLLDIPMHKGTLVAFVRLREYLRSSDAGTRTKGSSTSRYPRKVAIERENFKKQFKALFYLPGILTTLQPDTTTSIIETPYGSVTISY